MPYLSFISDEKIINAVSKVVNKILLAERDAEAKLHSNVIDPFSALFDAITHSITYENWIKNEKMRQAQKTMQNAIGDFHQEVLGGMYGCENLGLGGGLDIRNTEKMLIAEVKNKFNTTKGNHKIEVYDAIKSKLNEERHLGFSGYYVEIIPRGRGEYNKLFTPPDNKTQIRRSEDERIRVIDGKSFYALLSGKDFALQELFEVLPHIISEIFGYTLEKNEAREYLNLFAKAFPVR